MVSALETRTYRLNNYSQKFNIFVNMVCFSTVSIVSTIRMLAPRKLFEQNILCMSVVHCDGWYRKDMGLM